MSPFITPSSFPWKNCVQSHEDTLKPCKVGEHDEYEAEGLAPQEAHEEDVFALLGISIQSHPFSSKQQKGDGCWMGLYPDEEGCVEGYEKETLLLLTDEDYAPAVQGPNIALYLYNAWNRKDENLPHWSLRSDLTPKTPLLKLPVGLYEEDDIIHLKKVHRKYVASETTVRSSSHSTLCPSSDVTLFESKELSSLLMTATDTFNYEETMVILDWDDTLLPSSWLTERKLPVDNSLHLPQEEASLLFLMAEMARKTIETVSLWGRLVIVTNAENGWIELSCKRFFPNLLPVLKKYRIISARSAYSDGLPNDPFIWKRRAFMSEISKHLEANPAGKGNVLSIGDSSHERCALLNAKEELQNFDLKVKSVKLIDRPCIERLQREHEMIHKCFEKLVQFDGTLDLEVKMLSTTGNLEHPILSNYM